jgi:hypothetical protein
MEQEFYEGTDYLSTLPDQQRTEEFEYEVRLDYASLPARLLITFDKHTHRHTISHNGALPIKIV